VLPEGTPFGHLKIDEVFVEYDGPQLFSCSDESVSPRHFLAVHAPATTDADNWLYVLIDTQRLKNVASGKVTLHEAFSRPQDGTIHVVAFAPDHTQKITTTSPAELPDDWFPMAGERLGDVELPLDTAEVSYDAWVDTPEQLPAFLRQPAPMWEMSDEVKEYLKGRKTSVAEASRKTGRSIMDVVFRPLGDRSEMPAGALGSFLISIQNVVAALAPPAGKRGVPASELTRLDVLPAFAGSFGVRLDTHDWRLNPDPRMIEALHRMTALLSSSTDHSALQNLLREYGQHASSKYRVFIQAMEKSDSDVSVEIGIPNEEAVHLTSLTRIEVSKLAGFLRIDSAATEETILFKGQLVGVTIPKKFFALEDDEQIVSGRIADAALASMNGKTIGDRYEANITAITDLNEVTGEELTRYVLNSLQPVGESPA
jgi:hypothetical protein